MYKNMRRPIVLVDMDGVLADYDGKMLKEVRKHMESNPLEITRENLWSYLSINEHLKDKIEWEDGFFYSLEPIDGALEAIERMKKREWDIWICSSPSVTSKTCHSDKNNWLKKHFGDWLARKLILTKDKTLVIGDILIDDRGEIKGINQENTSFTHILFEQPYNSWSPCYKTGNVIKNWRDNWEEKLAYLVEYQPML